MTWIKNVKTFFYICAFTQLHDNDYLTLSHLSERPYIYIGLFVAVYRNSLTDRVGVWCRGFHRLINYTVLHGNSGSSAKIMAYSIWNPNLWTVLRHVTSPVACLVIDQRSSPVYHTERRAVLSTFVHAQHAPSVWRSASRGFVCVRWHSLTTSSSN